MSHEIKEDYTKQYIFPPCIEDWVPEDHPAQFVRDFVDNIDFREYGFKEFKGEVGNPHYADSMQLKIWLYGYFNKVRSSRGLERMCCTDVGAIWLTGNHTLDHNTIWRFFDRNKKALQEVLLKVTFVAQMNGLIGMVLHALDGTKIRARISDKSGWHSPSMGKKLREGIREVMNEIEGNERSDGFNYLLPEEVKDKTKRIEGIKRALKEMEKIGKKHLHPKDKDARMMKHGKGKSFCFNAQAVVDDESGLIVADDVVNDESDNNMLVPMIEKVEETLGGKAEETVADGGYYSPEQLVKADEKGLDVLVNISRHIEPKTGVKKFHKSRFKYDEDEDVFICPLGKELTFERIKDNSQKKYKVSVYRCHHRKDCPESINCSREKRGRSIELLPHHKVLQRQIRKQKEPGNKEILAKRKQIVEPVFGIIKEVLGFRRFTVRGLEKVKTQWALICAAFNLRKLFKVWKAGKLLFA